MGSVSTRVVVEWFEAYNVCDILVSSVCFGSLIVAHIKRISIRTLANFFWKMIYRADLQFESGFFDIPDIIRRISVGDMSSLALARCFWSVPMPSILSTKNAQVPLLKTTSQGKRRHIPNRNTSNKLRYIKKTWFKLQVGAKSHFPR